MKTSARPLTRRSGIGRRSFLTSTLFGAAGASVAMLAESPLLRASAPLTTGDINVLTFLAAAELIESDLWGQYSELATNNPSFRTALKMIDPSLPDYVNGDFADEMSHANLINAFLVANGGTAVNLSSFATIPSPDIKGATQTGRITNLTKLQIDTSYYNRYNSTENPDFGDTPAQEVALGSSGSPVQAIPTSNKMSALEVEAIAQTAAFHFGSIEQGGGSLYTALIGSISDPTALSILAAIGPTEIFHFSIFQSSLEGIRDLKVKGFPTFPDLRKDPDADRILPHPCTFLDASFPLCSVIRPSSIAKAGAVATATNLVNSGLFTGQSQAFFNAVNNLAANADAAQRNF